MSTPPVEPPHVHLPHHVALRHADSPDVPVQHASPDDARPFLPDDVAQADGGPARRVGVICPDAASDASFFAAALARTLSADGPVLLVDGQPGTGGLDVVLDLDRHPGARWAALRGADADIDGARLLAALPHRDGVAVLSQGRGPRVDLHADVEHAALEALGASVRWQVVTLPAHDPSAADACDDVLLLVRGTVCGMAAAQQYVDGLEASIEPALVALETPAAARGTLGDALGALLVASGPARWCLSAAANQDVLAGRWPGQSDRSMTALVRDAAVFLRSQGRCLAWA